MVDLTVIVPTYNCAGFLEECLDSILHQLPESGELVVVDDGSEDGTRKKLAVYGDRDPRVRITCREHRGASAARNTGLDMAWGKYVAFVDCDDCLRDHFFSDIRRLLEKDADLYIFGIERVFLEGNSEFWTVPDLEFGTASDFADEYIRTRHLLIYSNCNKLYRRSILEGAHIRFDESISFGEDRLLNYAYLRECDRTGQGFIVTSPVIMLRYLQRTADSQSSRYIPMYYEKVLKLHQEKIDCFCTISKGTSQEEKADFEAYDLKNETERAKERAALHPEEKEENDTI